MPGTLAALKNGCFLLKNYLTDGVKLVTNMKEACVLGQYRILVFGLDNGNVFKIRVLLFCAERSSASSFKVVHIIK